jgi:DHA1 family bicyclomycin/chloramphenicol resistance-like MFS transporter
MMLFSIGIGAASPVAVTTAISTDARMIGAASGLYGFMQMANGRRRRGWPKNSRPPGCTVRPSVLLAGTLLGQCFFPAAWRMMDPPHSKTYLRPVSGDGGDVP